VSLSIYCCFVCRSTTFWHALNIFSHLYWVRGFRERSIYNCLCMWSAGVYCILCLLVQTVISNTVKCSYRRITNNLSTFPFHIGFRLVQILEIVAINVAICETEKGQRNCWLYDDVVSTPRLCGVEENKGIMTDRLTNQLHGEEPSFRS